MLFRRSSKEPTPLLQQKPLRGKAVFVRCSLSCGGQQSKTSLRLTRASLGLALPRNRHRFLSSAVAVKLWLSSHAALLLTAALSVLQVLFRQAARHSQPSRILRYARLRVSRRAASRPPSRVFFSWLALASARSGFAPEILPPTPGIKRWLFAL